MRPLTYKFAFFVFTIFTLWGCSEPTEQAKEPVSRPVKTIVLQDDLLSGNRHFPGRIDAVQRAQVSFRVSGKVHKIHVKEGDFVKKGTVLAELDPTDFQITVNDRQATYNRAYADYSRGKELVKDGYISRTQFDKMRSDFSSAKAALAQANQNLKYTKLVAPFDGAIGKRYIDNFEEIQAKQEIFNLSDVSEVEIKIDVPERLMLQAQKQGANVSAYALFDSKVGEKYPLTLKEVAATANQQTQTFEATFVMPQPEGLNLLAGMTANVKLEATSTSQAEQFYLVPTSAVKGAIDMTPTVFVVDPKTSTLKATPVTVGEMMNDQIQVTEGLNVGDRIVIAGISFMRDGDKVTLMNQVEQADPATAP